MPSGALRMPLMPGKAIHDVLLDGCVATNITLREKWMAIDLITNRHLKAQRRAIPHGDLAQRCHGIYALDIENQRVETLPASAVVMATGGVGKVYRYTSNPETSTGDGIAMVLAGRLPRGEHGVHPVPSHVPVSPAGALVS